MTQDGAKKIIAEIMTAAQKSKSIRVEESANDSGLIKELVTQPLGEDLPQPEMFLGLGL